MRLLRDPLHFRLELPDDRQSCARLGDVALYAEFAFEAAVIANNIVDDAAMGISVTNFSEGGRLAVVQGNLICTSSSARTPTREASASRGRPTAW